MNVRSLEAADLARVLAIEAASFPDPWNEELFRQELGRSDRVWRVGTDEGSVVAYGGVMIVGDEAHLMDLAVDPAHRERGIA